MVGPGLFIGYVILLAVMLLYPASHWIWALSVNRLQRRLERELTAEEKAGQWRRALIIGSVVCLIFSFLFNLSTVGMPQ